MARLPADQGAAIGYYDGTGAEPAAVVRWERVYTDYERKGFFRIGALPLVAIQGLTLEVNHPAFLTNSLARVHQWLGSRAATRVELRRVTIQIAATVTNRLEVTRARLTAEGKWQLSDGVSFLAGTNRVAASRGVLEITGSCAGRLTLGTDPLWSQDLFAGAPVPALSSQEKPP